MIPIRITVRLLLMKICHNQLISPSAIMRYAVSIELKDANLLPAPAAADGEGGYVKLEHLSAVQQAQAQLQRGLPPQDGVAEDSGSRAALRQRGRSSREVSARRKADDQFHGGQN